MTHILRYIGGIWKVGLGGVGWLWFLERGFVDLWILLQIFLPALGRSFEALTILTVGHEKGRCWHSTLRESGCIRMSRETCQVHTGSWSIVKQFLFIGTWLSPWISTTMTWDLPRFATICHVFVGFPYCLRACCLRNVSLGKLSAWQLRE